MTDDGIVTQLTVTLEEWQAIVPFLDLVAPWETKAIGHIRFTGDGVQRHWYVTDSYRMARLTGLGETERFDLLIPPRLALMAPKVCSESNETTLLAIEPPTGSPYYVVKGDVGEIMAPRLMWGYPDTDPLIDSLIERSVDVEVDAERLDAALRSIGIRPEPTPDGEFPPPLEFGCDQNGLWLRVTWPECGPSVIVLDARTSGREVEKRANLTYLGELVSGMKGTLRLSFGDDPNEPLTIVNGSTFGFLMPLNSGLEVHRRHVQDVIGNVFGPDALIRDIDGDYQIKTTGVPVWARLLDGQPPALQVFATVAADISSSPELLSELNDMNSRLRFVRVEWSNNIITARCELVAETLDPDELFTAFQRVNQVAEETSPLFVTMYGGHDLNRDAERWVAYLQTDVIAEMSPESWSYLNGTSAIVDWPFEAPVHVITAHNPYNISRSDSENAQANRELAAELGRRGARFCMCAGEARDGDHAELGFLVWNLDIDEVRRVADQFRQEAVFEITESEFRLVHVRTGEVTSGPRRA